MVEADLAALTDEELLEALGALLARSRRTEAEVLLHLAEVETRGLHVPAGFPSMHAYCVSVLHLSEDAAFKRIQAARVARKYPLVLDALADGRLHLSAVCMLAPHLRDDNVASLVAAAAHRSKRELQALLAERAPRPDVPELIVPAGIAGTPIAPLLAPGQVADRPGAITHATPLGSQRYALQLTIGAHTHEKLLRAQALLRHRVFSGDLAEVIDHALDSLLTVLVRERFAITGRPRMPREPREPRGRRVPAQVRRAVHERDGEQCTFVSADGVRCTARAFLQFDHVEPFSRGGKSTVANLRLLCAAHNQYEAERRFGRAYVAARRNGTRAAAAQRRASAGSDPSAATSVPTSATPGADPEPTGAPSAGNGLISGWTGSPSSGSGSASAGNGAPSPATGTRPASSGSASRDDGDAEAVRCDGLDWDQQAFHALRGLGVKPADARDAVVRSARATAATLEQRVVAALRALRTTYANRCTEPALRWGRSASSVTRWGQRGGPGQAQELAGAHAGW